MSPNKFHASHLRMNIYKKKKYLNKSRLSARNSFSVINEFLLEISGCWDENFNIFLLLFFFTVH